VLTPSSTTSVKKTFKHSSLLFRRVSGDEKPFHDVGHLVDDDGREVVETLADRVEHDLQVEPDLSGAGFILFVTYKWAH
jgi:hypothetical protein